VEQGMKVLVVTNGTITDTGVLKGLAANHETILCADGAVRHIRKIDRLPTKVVGDLDSISQDDLKWIKANHIPVLQYDVRKDFTDTEIAVSHALEIGASAITIVGAWGSRVDHSLGNLYLLKLISEHRVEGMIVDRNLEISLISENKKLSWKKGETVSFIPVSEKVLGLTLKGFEYNLDAVDLKMGSSRCISNIVATDNPEIRLTQGFLFAIRNK
jgi:thiamine pyrophosphokinase